MQEYRIYLFDQHGHIDRPPTIVECADDQAAIEQAKQYLNGRFVEVWDGARRVIRLDPIHLTP
jgi:hypothetical protein